MVRAASVMSARSLGERIAQGEALALGREHVVDKRAAMENPLLLACERVDLVGREHRRRRTRPRVALPFRVLRSASRTPYQVLGAKPMRDSPGGGASFVFRLNHSRGDAQQGSVERLLERAYPEPSCGFPRKDGASWQPGVDSPIAASRGAT
jgi:hypothetical protein